MKTNRLTVFGFRACLCGAAFLLFALVSVQAAEPRVVELWPEGVPGLKADWSAEKVVDGRISNIHKPTMLVFSPPEGKGTGTAVVFCSGGGYMRIAVNNNGNPMTQRLVADGVTVFMLKYRLS